MYKQSYTLQVGMYYQNWADELTLFKPRGADFARHTTTNPPPGFKILPTPLIINTDYTFWQL